MEKITIPVLSPYYGPTAGFTKPFQNFIREIGDCRSKYVRNCFSTVAFLDYKLADSYAIYWNNE